MTSPSRVVGLVSALLILSVGAAHAERLPIRQYTTADGLPHDRITRIVSDARGLLWFCTGNGLSRFDGNRFVNYLPPGTNVSDVAAGPDGVYWIGVWRGGLLRLDPAERRSDRMIQPVTGDYSRAVRRLVFDRTGRLWVGTSGGLFLVEHPGEVTGGRAEFRLVELEGPEGSPAPNIWEMVIDRHDRVWIATDRSGLQVLSPSGGVARLEPVPGQIVTVASVVEDDEGGIWTGHDLGVTVYDEELSPTWFGPEVVGKGIVVDLLQSSDGAIWLTRFKEGVTRFDETGFVEVMGERNAPSQLVRPLAEDDAGNLWIGTEDAGALRLASMSFTVYDREDGLPFSRYASLLEDRGGHVIVAAGDALYAFDGKAFEAVRPAALSGLDTGRQSDNPRVLLDSRGGWWLGTPDGLFRYPAGPVQDLARGAVPARYTARDGLSGDQITALFEDSRGDVWIGTKEGGLTRWDRRSGAFRNYPSGNGVPRSAARSFAEDPAGNLWIGFDNGVARHDSEGFAEYSRADGLTADQFVYGMFLDHRGRLWITSLGTGVNRVDDPAAASPAFLDMAREGIEDRFVWSTVEDDRGRVYLGTLDGVVRLDPGTGSVRRFTTADGLSSNEISYAMRDHAGGIWFCSVRGVTHLAPRGEPPEGSHPPPIWVSGVRIAGEPHPVSDLGEAAIGGLVIGPNRASVEIDFGGIDFKPGETLNYQYRLQGAEGDWSSPSPQRTVHFANLAPGHYRFQVRSVAAEGLLSEQPASVDFQVLAPIWRRGWFLMASGLVMAGAFVAFHRYRLARVLELERVRTRIASDLHDDIGSSLSQISLLSEQARRHLLRGDLDVQQLLVKIAGASRELVDSMSDIVWAINPRRDNLDDLVQRMRRFAGDSLASREIQLDFQVRADDRQLALGPERRRELYLIFKESLNNALKHAGCSRVEVTIEAAGGSLKLSIRDDGKGFHPEPESGGHGLMSMSRRAEGLGGTLHVEGRPGAGTSVLVDIPTRARRR